MDARSVGNSVARLNLGKVDYSDQRGAYIPSPESDDDDSDDDSDDEHYLSSTWKRPPVDISGRPSFATMAGIPLVARSITVSEKLWKREYLEHRSPQHSRLKGVWRPSLASFHLEQYNCIIYI